MEVLREPPKTSSFVPLSEHQSTTPASFYAGPPILHFHSSRCNVVILERDVGNSPPLAAFSEHARASSGANVASINGSASHVETEDEGLDAQKIVEDVEVWVTSDKLFLYSDKSSIGVSIPYPSISLHAIQSLPVPSAQDQQGIYMQLMPVPSAAEEEDDDPESVSMTIIPPPRSPPLSSSDPESANEGEMQTPTVSLFTALSNCSNLHPDPVDAADQVEMDLRDSTLFQAGMIAPGDTGGGLPPPMPGSSGWITAENMSEYFDEEGNWIGDSEEQEDADLGSGAGTVRPRPNDDQDEQDGEGDQTKWRRTS